MRPLDRGPLGMRRWPIWQYPGVPPLVGATAISNVGTEISGLAIPLVAVSVLHASNSAVAMLDVAAYVSMLLFTLPIGLIADRINRKYLMVGADVACAAGVAAVPIMGVAGMLSVPLLVLVLVVVHFFSTLHIVCSEAVVPDIVDDRHLDSVNGVLNTTRATSEVAGPGLGGIIVSTVGALMGLVVDAVSFLASAWLLARVPVRSLPSIDRERRTAKAAWDDVVDGFRVYRADKRLLRILGSSATSNFFSTMAGAVEILFLVRVLDVAPWGVGVAFTITAVGGVVGGFVLGPLQRRVGKLRVILVSQFVLAAPILLVPLARPGLGVSLYLIGWFCYSLSSVVYASAIVSYRQRVVPRALLGRCGAASRWVGGTASALGALAAAALLGFWEIRPVVLISSLGIYVSGFWLLSSVIFRDEGGAARSNVEGVR